MNFTDDTERLDTLLALALVSEAASAAGAGPVGEIGADTAAADEGRERAFKLLSGLEASERLAAERRAEWLARLAPEKRREWLAHVLGRARASRAAQLDAHVHPSHVIEALANEPARVRRVILGELPSPLASNVASGLGLNAAHRGGARPAGEVVEAVRRKFLARFVSQQDLGRPSGLDLLSGADLARIVRLLGVREAAMACRGIESKEAVASFLRRFAAEDARAVAAQLATLNEADPERIAFAQEVVRDSLQDVMRETGGSGEAATGARHAAMLDRAGLRVLALALAGRGAAHLRHTEQKLPVEASRWLRSLCADWRRPERAVARRLAPRVAREAESLAAEMRRRRGGEKESVKSPEPGDVRPTRSQRTRRFGETGLLPRAGS